MEPYSELFFISVHHSHSSILLANWRAYWSFIFDHKPFNSKQVSKDALRIINTLHPL
ncbi:hypothetical protein BDC45DRAFT_591571, partial [Circinella umbellata]